MASSYSKLWSSRTPRVKAGCAAGEPELGKEIRPSEGVCACGLRAKRENTETNKPRRHKDTEKNLTLCLRVSVAVLLRVLRLLRVLQPQKLKRNMICVMRMNPAWM